MARFIISNIPGELPYCGSDRQTRVLQNAKNLIMCRMGEVPYDRMRGLAPEVMDMPLEELNGKLLQEIDRVMGWEPRVRAAAAWAEPDENGETVIYAAVETDVI